MCKNEREHGIEGGGSERERDLIGMNMAFNIQNTVARRISATGAKKTKGRSQTGQYRMEVDSWWEIGKYQS